MAKQTAPLVVMRCAETFDYRSYKRSRIASPEKGGIPTSSLFSQVSEFVDWQKQGLAF